MAKNIPLEILDHLSYDPKTGKFTWLKTTTGRKAGDEAGCRTKAGYVTIGFNYKSYKAHRVAFLCMGKDVPDVVDHINNDPSDSRWDNLRPSCFITNGYNRGVSKNSTTRLKGAFPNARCSTYKSQIVVEGKQIYLGNFKTAEEAHEAYKEAASKYHKVFKNYG